MEAKKRGSAILMILIVITVIGTIAASALKINGLIGQLVIERGECQKKRAALDALALYGIALSYSQYHHDKDLAKEAKEPIVKKFDSWPPANKQYQGMVTVTPEKKQWVIQAQLGQNNQFSNKITAHVRPTQDGWEVSRWNYMVK